MVFFYIIFYTYGISKDVNTVDSDLLTFPQQVYEIIIWILV
jgi:hypothetical protein